MCSGRRKTEKRAFYINVWAGSGAWLCRYYFISPCIFPKISVHTVVTKPKGRDQSMEKKKCILKKWEAALLIGLCVCIIASLCSFTAECEDISTRVLRLHILANSDSPADQALKLKVRNRLLEVGSGLFDQVNTESEAEQVAAQRLDELKLAAEQVVRSEGYDYSVTVQLCRAWFDTREYSDVTLPAGEYNALRVLIGEGGGKNWWCVMFPPMCIPAAEPNAELQDVLTKEQTDIVKNQPKYEFRFKAVELFESFKQWLSER